MIRVRIEMDEGWSWWPETEQSQKPVYGLFEPTMEIPEELVKEYQTLNTKWVDLQRKLEQLYRIQEGMAPWGLTSIPEHKLLEK